MLRIDCDECRMQHTEACDDCVVTFLCDRPAGGVVEVEQGDARVIHLLAEVGLVPELRLQRRTG